MWDFFNFHLCSKRNALRINCGLGPVTYMASRLKYTRNVVTYYLVIALLTAFYKLIVVWICVLVCYKSNMGIGVKSVITILTVSDPFKIVNYISFQ